MVQWLKSASHWVHDLVSASFVNVSIRVVTMAARFVLVLYLGKRLSLANIGGFGLISALVSLGMYFIGLELYLFTIRDLVARPQARWGAYIRDQFVVYGMMYLLAILGGIGFVLFRKMAWPFLLIAPTLLVLEHICQEVYRILEASRQPRPGLLFLFLRSGAWVFIFIILCEWFPAARTLTWLCIVWIFGCLGGLAFAWRYLRDFGWDQVAEQSIDWVRIRQALKVSFLYFLGALALRAIPMADRLLVDRVWGQSEVGIYTFFFNIANGIQDFVNAGVIIVCYPAFLTAVRLEKTEEASQWYRKLRSRILGAALILIVLAVATLWLARGLWIGKFPSYSIFLFMILALANGFQLFALVPYFRLYAFGHDVAVLMGSLGFMAMVLALDVFLVPRYGAMGAGLGFCLGSLGLWGLRWGQGLILVPMRKVLPSNL